MASMQRVRNIIGKERPLREVAQALLFGARSMSPSTVGALHLTCADESENECAEALQHGFVKYLLPTLKFARQSAFRLANLGGRYEWGAVRLAESHYALPRADNGFKFLLVKINSHVACEASSGSLRLGTWKRYGRTSSCCGALAHMLAGDRQPSVDQLAETFRSEGHDRIAALRDPAQVYQLYAPLYAAMVSARLQARKAVLDIQDYVATSPTYYLVLPCVTINRQERDTEIVCGMYTVDGRSGSTEAVYSGLGDLPEGYSTVIEHTRFVVTDDQLGAERKGRDHRAMVRAALHERAPGSRISVKDERLERVHADVVRNKHRHKGHARQLLRIALPVLAEVAPIPAAMLAFGDGAAGIHHALKIHKLAAGMKDTEEARQILNDVESRIDQLDDDRAEALLELLVAEYK